MRSVALARRVAALVALAAVVAAMAIVLVALARHLLWLVLAMVCLWLAVAAAAYAVTRTGARRLVAAVVAVVALVAPLLLLVLDGRLLHLVLLVVLLALAGAATRYALGRDLKSLKSGPTPGTEVGPARRPVLLMNPKSGGGKVERFGLGLIGDRVFVNNATVGLYAKIVRSPAWRDRKVGTALELLPAMLGADAAPLDLRFTGPDGTEHPSAHLVLVANDRYELGRAEGFGSRRRMDAGTLGIVAAKFGSSKDAARFAQRQADRSCRRRPAGWLEWTDTTFE
ncbi:MAG TPA: hypothetical protein VF880_06135, partial [Actinomycetes bacterium]